MDLEDTVDALQVEMIAALSSGQAVPWVLDSEQDKPCKHCGGYNVTLRMHGMQVRADCSSCKRRNGESVWVKFIEKARLQMPTLHHTPDYRREIKPKQRQEAFKRANYTCELCGKYALGDLHADHMYSLADARDNGDINEPWVTSLDNIAALCGECNSGKGRSSFPLEIRNAIRKRREDNA